MIQVTFGQQPEDSRPLISATALRSWPAPRITSIITPEGWARREWANANEELLIRFIRAMVRATDWVMDRKDKEEVIKLLLAENKNSQARAEEMYEESVSPRFGFMPRSRIDMEGIRAVLQMRETAGLMKPPLPKAEKYVDDRFYKKALQTLDR